MAMCVMIVLGYHITGIITEHDGRTFKIMETSIKLTIRQSIKNVRIEKFLTM